MSRIARNTYQTRYFHIIVQGIKKEYIFENYKYKEKYKELIFKYKEKYNIRIFAYCIMDNHAHMLIFTENISDMSNFMKCINTSYGHYYNENLQRVGFVFRDRYLSEPIYSEKHLLTCIQYIHLNPVKAEIVDLPEKYKYSSYKHYINKNGIVNSELLEILFGSTKNYIEKFLKISEKVEFIDYEKPNDNINQIIDKYCSSKNIKLDEIYYNEKEIAELVIYLVIDKKIKIVNVVKTLQINRFKIRRLIKNRTK